MTCSETRTFEIGQEKITFKCEIKRRHHYHRAKWGLSTQVEWISDEDLLKSLAVIAKETKVEASPELTRALDLILGPKKAKCPECYGDGKIAEDHDDDGNPLHERECDTCGGTGLVDYDRLPSEMKED